MLKKETNVVTIPVYMPRTAGTSNSANGIIQPNWLGSVIRACENQYNPVMKWPKPNVHPSKKHFFLDLYFSIINNRPVKEAITQGKIPKGENAKVRTVPRKKDCK